MLREIIGRFALAVIVVAAVVAYVGMPQVDRLASSLTRLDAENRARSVMQRISPPLAAQLRSHERAELAAVLQHLQAENHTIAIAVCRPNGALIAATEERPAAVACEPDTENGNTLSRIADRPESPIHIARFELAPPGAPPVRVMIAQDLGIGGYRRTARDYVLAFAAVSTFSLISLVALTAWWLLRRWVSILVNDIRSGRFLDDARSPLSLPILSRVREAMQEAEAQQRLEIDYQENWTPLALQQVVRTQVRAEQIIVVSNRQPYSHVYGTDGSVHVQIPASGMVTALEPIIRACSGVWIAHGSGSADHDVVDRNDRIAVPPGEPSYALRRVWLTPEEEEGYYYGFSNEGLWPLCHIAYVRPAFRLADWQAYQAVNRKFATVIAGEATSARPVVLIQDFHFSLLPLLIRERLPRATIVLFWHVPWPNAETFGVCPWKGEILRHMLSADILGFHTRYHCQNFLATVDRFIECQIDHVHMTVTSHGRVCEVMPYPISIEWPPRWLSAVTPAQAAREAVGRRYGIADSVKLCVGVERWDFTKGIVERFQALEIFLESNAAMHERVTLLQIAAPSRSKLPAYQALQRQCLAEVERINTRFATGGWHPIVLIAEHRPPESIFELYRAADVCLVTSLHDGMNLVAKEFVAARDDEDGVLILSTFAGAAQELGEALLVNPFDVAQTAQALEAALNMPRVERRERMRLLRRTVKVNNVFRWAGRMLMDAAKIRQRQSLRSGRSMTGTK